ncbi:UNVERIFIED_CONTAM: hypothetical protein K2H54_058426 [Gekko kuhli]
MLGDQCVQALASLERDLGGGDFVFDANGQHTVCEVSMAPGKGKGQTKGKHLAPIRPNLEPVRPKSSDEEDDPIKAAILACLDALEKQRGKHALPPTAPEGTKKGKPKASAFQAKILVRLAIMEDDQGTSGDQQGSGQQRDNADDRRKLEVYRGPKNGARP